MQKISQQVVVSEIILDVSGRPEWLIVEILKKLKDATNGKVVWYEGSPLDIVPHKRIFRLIYVVSGGYMRFETKVGYTTSDQLLYKRIPSWIKAIVKERGK